MGGSLSLADPAQHMTMQAILSIGLEDADPKLKKKETLSKRGFLWQGGEGKGEGFF